MDFTHKGKKYKIETRPVVWRVTRYKAVAVSDEGEVEIPGCICDTPSLAEFTGLLKVTFMPGVEPCPTSD